MKLHTLAAAACLAAGSAQAGGLSAPVVEPVMSPVVIEEDSGSSGGFVVPLLLLAVIVAVAAQSGDSDPGEVLSDLRLKTDVARVGTTAGGLPLYQFRYLGGATLYEGVMAQDVMMHRPDAVRVVEGGYMVVDYAALGLELKTIR